MSKPTKGPRLHTIPPGDNRKRLVCPECDYVAYENPKVVVGVVATWEGRLLMCKRDIEPRRGFWTLPAGFLEMGETPAEGAAREAYEEACANLEIIDLLSVYSITHISQLQLFYRARLISPDVAAGEESIEARLFEFDALPPLEEIAFPTVLWAIDAFKAAQGKAEIAPFGNPPGAEKYMRRR